MFFTYKKMGASFSVNAQEAHPRVVSHFSEFMTEGLTEEDRELVSSQQVKIGEHGIMMFGHTPELLPLPVEPDKPNPALDMLMESHSSPFRSVFFDMISGVTVELIARHAVQRGLWRNDYYVDRQTEQVDLADVTDWFPIFVNYVGVRSVEIQITTKLDTIKLHRALRFLFYLGALQLREIIITFDAPMRSLLEEYITSAWNEVTKIDRTVFKDVVNYRGPRISANQWSMTEKSDGQTTQWTFRYHP
jgi:hypothetical protein